MPLRVPQLAFGGYNSSFFSPLSAEVAAWWIADYINGSITLPAAEAMAEHVQRRLVWMEERTEGKHARGTNIIPFSMHNVDEMLEDLGLDVSGMTKMTQWLMPVNPKSYRKIGAKLRARHAKAKPVANLTAVSA
jgi:dimethylaniline monooxygenase (N-oxide forming)